MKDEFVLTLELTDIDIKQLAATLDFHYQNWPGYPAAEPEEQERINFLRQVMRCALMEVSFLRGSSS